MPWLTTVERLREQSPSLCRCNHLPTSHEPTHKAVTTHDGTGEQRVEYLCTNGTARLVHEINLYHPAMNPTGKRP